MRSLLPARNALTIMLDLSFTKLMRSCWIEPEMKSTELSTKIMSAKRQKLKR